ncbi:MAG: class I SAM-dependent methyltransferase [Oscillatoriaceae cyanobacterium Prado104]|nr:class I SAM-dependent methyltransferase [Oscillatoriaceae cyanobacterium Prado104]
MLELDINPDIILEPTCGVGNFIQAAAHSFPLVRKIIGVEINPNYLEEIQKNKQLSQDERIQIQQGNFFDLDWSLAIDKFNEKILVLGNFPWITNSQQGAIGGKNLPQKNNFQNYNGLDAITGKSNFDISEWMLIHSIQWLQNLNREQGIGNREQKVLDGELYPTQNMPLVEVRASDSQKRDSETIACCPLSVPFFSEACLAMLCKTSVARKILNYIRSRNLNLAYCATYGIDAKKYFDANVDACLLVCKFESNSQNYFCDVFCSLDAENSYRIGYRNDIPIRDLATFDKLIDLHNPKAGMQWRSGIKHDCSSVMELRKVDNEFINGLGEVADIEETCLFPLIKGSAVAQNRWESSDRYLLVTQRYIGEPTEYLQKLAPKTWNYLTDRSEYLDRRKSKIYKQSSRFSIFGVGTYTFAPWKIAICGLYKKLNFRLIGEINGKPAVFDDTVYFLSFEDEKIARQIFALLISPTALDFYDSLIFWDEKRPIKSSILNSLDLVALAKRLPANL